MGKYVKSCVDSFPMLDVETSLHPITRNVMRVKVFITPQFKWNDSFNGKACEKFYVWVEDPDNDTIYHFESCVIPKAMVANKGSAELIFTVQLVEPMPSQYLLRVSSDRWMRTFIIN